MTITLAAPLASEGYVCVKGVGTFRLAAPLHVRRFALAEGTKLAIDGALPENEWGSVLTADESLSLDSDALVADRNFKVRVVTNADGSKSVQARARQGMVLMVK